MLLFIDSAVLARHCGGAADSEAASSAAAVRSAASCARHRSWRSDDAGRRWRLRCFADEELRLLTRSAAAASRVPSASTRCDVESSWPPRVPHAVFSLRCGEWWLRRRAVVGASTTAHALRLPEPQPACRRHRRRNGLFLAVAAGNSAHGAERTQPRRFLCVCAAPPARCDRQCGYVLSGSEQWSERARGAPKEPTPATPRFQGVPHRLGTAPRA